SDRSFARLIAPSGSGRGDGSKFGKGRPVEAWNVAFTTERDRYARRAMLRTAAATPPGNASTFTKKNRPIAAIVTRRAHRSRSQRAPARKIERAPPTAA